MRARLRFIFNKQSWTEEYILRQSTPLSALPYLNWLCRLRSVWLATGITIQFASVSDLGSGRDGVAADALPYQYPGFTLFPGYVSNDVSVGYEYRLQSQSGFRATRQFRGIPDIYISNMQAVGGAWLPNAGGVPGTTTAAAGGPVYDTTGGMGAGNTGNYTLAAQSFVNFLCQWTLGLTPPTGPGPTYGTISWDDVLFRQVATRRTGKVLFKTQGRFVR